MIQRIFTGGDAMTLKISIQTVGEQDIRLIVKDSNQANTILTDVTKTISSENGSYVNGGYSYDYYVMMPLCKNYVDIIIVNATDNSDNGFIYNGCKKLPLVRRMSDVDFTAFHLQEYISFIQKFSYNAGVIRVNDKNNPDDFYVSSGKNFWIKYLPSITDAETGEEIDTPARIATDGSFIEVSQKDFVNYSVPMRVAILLHEYSHPFFNEDQNNETEADLNGLFVYLALGYPRIEGGQAWCEVAYNAPTDENVDRVAIIYKFIADFDNNKMVIYN